MRISKVTTITMKKRNQPGWLIWLLVILPFLFPALIQLLGMPAAIRYLLDAAWLALLVYMCRFLYLLSPNRIVGLIVWSIVFFAYTFLVYLVQYQSVFYYLWGFRNNFRFYVAFFAFAYFLHSTDRDDYFAFFDKLFWINFAVTLVQCFGMRLYADNLGGIFGTESGCNGYSVIFMSIVVTKTIVFYLEKKENAVSCLLKCAASLFIAAAAELKFFFVLFVVILALSILFTGFTWRKFLLIMGGAVGIAVGTALLTQMISQDENWFTLEWMLEVVTSDRGYTSSGDLNRLNAIPRINELWLKTFGQRMFGLGLGNTDTSGFAIVNTPFFEQHGDMHYSWMSYAMIYLETGYIGLAMYYGFFVMVFLGAYRIEKHSEENLKSYCRIARIMAVSCVMIAVYNSSLRTEAGYMAYFVLAMPYVQRIKQA